MVENVAEDLDNAVTDLGTALLRLMLGAWADDEIGPVLLAVLQTAAHEPITREKLTRVVESSLMGVSQLGDDERDRLVRSGLISSQIMGLAMMRYVWKIEPVASMSDDERRRRCRAEPAALHRGRDPMNTMIELEPQPRIDTLVRLPVGGDARRTEYVGTPWFDGKPRCPD